MIDNLKRFSGIIQSKIISESSSEEEKQEIMKDVSCFCEIESAEVLKNDSIQVKEKVVVMNKEKTKILCDFLHRYVINKNQTVPHNIQKFLGRIQ